MHVGFVERVLEDGRFEVSIVEGREELKAAIAGKFVFPEKLILTAQQREENKDGLRDILTGAFCLQGIKDVIFTVRNEKGEPIKDYSKSLYDQIGPHGMA